MAHDNAELAALIGSRICHDLISPIGAITNGLELLDLTGAVQGPELDLIADSVGNAGARIRFFRIAFGAAGEHEIGRAEIAAILADLGRGGRMRLVWSVEGPQKRSLVRLAFLAILCCETALAHGGSVTVSRDGETWTITAHAERMAVDAELWARLSSSDPADGVTPAQVQFVLLPVVARDLGRPVATGIEPGLVRITF